MMDRVDILQTSTADMIDDLDTRLLHIVKLINDNELDPNDSFDDALRNLAHTINIARHMCRMAAMEKKKLCTDPDEDAARLWRVCRNCDGCQCAPSGEGYYCIMTGKTIEVKK